MYIVSLEKMEFVAMIGLFPEEALIANNIEVEISLAVTTESIDNLPFIDYGVVYQIVANALLKNHTTLELLLQHIYKDVNRQFATVKQNISVKKMNPPIHGRVQASNISWKEF